MKKFLSVALVVVMLFSFAGCGNNDPLVGTWKIDVNATTAGMSDEQKALVEATISGMNMSLTFGADGSASTSITLNGETQNQSGKYRTEGGNLYLIDSNGEQAIAYSLENGVLKINLNGQSLTLKKA